MAGLRKILITLLVLVLILLALVFSLNNQMAVSLNFLLFETQPPHGVAVWIIMAFVIGALVGGVLVTTMATVRTSVSRRHLQKRLERTEHALEKSRAQNDRAL